MYLLALFFDNFSTQKLFLLLQPLLLSSAKGLVVKIKDFLHTLHLAGGKIKRVSVSLWVRFEELLESALLAT